MDADSVLRAFTERGVEHVKLNEPLALHTTWRIGGPADVFVNPHTVEELRSTVSVARQLEVPWTVIGRGSNLLVRDGGIRGLVVQLGDRFGDIRVDGNELTALAGRSAVSAASIAVRNQLAGLEFATGIPGTVGGVVMMNAGAHGGQVSDVLHWADVMDTAGNIRRLSKADLQFGYRYSILRDEPGIVVAACFSLTAGDGAALIEKVKTWSQRRLRTQPLSLPSCGSVFRNPSGTHAGHLIELAGLKGLQRGGAQISEKHANFIVNIGGATAEDVLWLIAHAQDTVQQLFGISLETEVRVMGDAASGR
ncbi:UDP-N-acetylmuramate dehydrogenase [Alicyclobacillus sp. ALC3]|uniref:UDP-N-acetylmuramate dehydrogenase n=1 Tax=Alicyclobacillus sp. ALC3 TaxID=2796143 RepID=UPI002378C687|nr:UDP-N-acetylmuramate dehydrogenase [Alicyclobacillus sp. ALC3]WDL97445.1 UDP-N-acetylmuramate dehydrogenase [Alicyclobacillus sp. ALC3]